MIDPTDETTCRWHQDGDSDSDLWGTSCRNYFRLEDGTPTDNKMRFCCYCGKPLKSEPWVDEVDQA